MKIDPRLLATALIVNLAIPVAWRQAPEAAHENAAGEPLRKDQPGVVFADTAMSRLPRPGMAVFRDRDYRLKEWPREIDGAILLQTNMDGTKRLRCIRPGMVYFLTPLPGHSEDSQSQTLEQQGFAQAAIPSLPLLGPGGPASRCALYQKRCAKGDVIEFGKWAVPVVLEETRTSAEDASPVPGTTMVMVAGREHPVPIVNFNPGPQYADANRRFGIASSISRTPRGRLWCGFSSGGEAESQDNYGVVVISDDDGLTWSEPFIVFDQDGPGGIRSDHVTVWTDPSGILWIMWSEYPEGLLDPHSSLWAITCANPDDDNPAWSEPRKLVDQQNLLTTPTVLSNGTWVFPTGNWQREQNNSRPIISRDNGRTFELGGELTVAEKPDFDEYMIVEHSDGRLIVFNRHSGSFLQCESRDGGRTWTPQRPNGLPHTNARFVFMRLRSGNWLLVKHGPMDQVTGRLQLMAFLSRNEGETWEGGLMLDDRDCSYPFGSQTTDGTIYVSYERQRWLQPEILLARFTEEDVAAGRAVSDRAALRLLVNKAGGVSEIERRRSVPPPPRRDNVDGAAFRNRPAGRISADGYQESVYKVGAILFRDRSYALAECPKELEDALFLHVPMEGDKRLRCTRSGMVYVLTPLPDRNPSGSQSKKLEQQGFKKVALPEVELFEHVSRPANHCTLYQRECSEGDTIEFGKWAVPVFLRVADDSESAP